MNSTSTPSWLSNPRIRLEESPDGLPIFQLEGGFGFARFTPQGAHLMDFTPAGQRTLLFLSKRSALTPGKAVRGGIPVIFPWFGARSGHPESPMHGLVRTRMWEIAELEVPAEGAARLQMTFHSNAETLALWPHAFSLRVAFTLGTDLSVCWETRNTGAEAFVFEQALHPYFPVADVATASVHGLLGTEFIDKTDALSVKTDPEQSLFFSGETDRVYLDTEASLTLRDPACGLEISVTKAGSNSSVVWNPWVAKAAALSDLEDDDWQRFVCVEQANAGRNAVSLPAGGVHTFEANYGWRPICCSQK